MSNFREYLGEGERVKRYAIKIRNKFYIDADSSLHGNLEDAMFFDTSFEAKRAEGVDHDSKDVKIVKVEIKEI